MSDRFFWWNEELKFGEPNTKLYENSTIVYEVVRIYNGVSLFLEDHIVRFRKSCEKLKIDFIPEVNITNKIKELSRQNNQSIGNVMIKWFFFKGEVHNLIDFIPFYYPTEIEYQNGVKVFLMSAERKNPQAKFVQKSVREKANTLIEEKNVYEVLLINHLNQITEGSRSNLFFIKDECLFIPPFDQILKGITLQKVLTLALNMNVNIKQTVINQQDLKSFDAIGLTGTSPKVVPVASIGNLKFDSQNKLLRRIMNEYDKEIERYVNKKGNHH